MPNFIDWPPAAITAANTARDGTGTVNVALQAASELYVEKLVFQAAGTNVTTVARIFINNGEPNTLASNNVLWGEVDLPSTTASATAAVASVTKELGFWLPARHRLLVTLGTAVAAGYCVTAIAWDRDPLVNTQR